MTTASTITAYLASPFGGLTISAQGDALVSIEFVPLSADVLPAPSDPLLREAIRQFRAYFADPHVSFFLPWRCDSTPFRQKVWRAMLDIPPGQTLSYGDLARDLSSSARAIGGACRANRLPILIPCHRVLSSKGGLGGYCGGEEGPLLEIKRWLLQHEGYALR